MAVEREGNMERNQKNGLLIVVLINFSFIGLLALNYNGANSLIIGTYVIIMFIVQSTLTVKMITQRNSRKGTREQHL